MLLPLFMGHPEQGCWLGLTWAASALLRQVGASWPALGLTRSWVMLWGLVCMQVTKRLLGICQ